MSDEEEAKLLKDTDNLAEQLRNEDNELISMLSNQDDQRMMRSIGGNLLFGKTPT